MGVCQSRTRAADILPQAGKQVRSSNKPANNSRKSKKLKLEIQKYDAANLSVFSPSGTQETTVVSPSSSLPSSGFSAATVHNSTPEEEKHYSDSKMGNPTINANEEIEIHLDSIIANYETQSIPAVPSNVVDQFQQLKLQAQQADDSTKRRKRREKIESRKEMVDEYQHLWQDYEEIQNRVNCQNTHHGIPESISFLQDSDAWYIDFHAIHHQQQAYGNVIDPSGPSVANLSLLSQANIEAQKKFFKKKSIERKQRRKRKGSLKPSMVVPTEDQSLSSNFLGLTSVQQSAQDSKRMKADSTMRYVDANDYNVPHRNRSSSTSQHAESYLHQALSHPEPVEAVVPSSITLDKNFPRRRNQDLQRVSHIDYALSQNERRGNFGATKQSGDSFNPISEMSKEQFLMMSSPKVGITDEAVKRYEEVPIRSPGCTNNPILNTTNDRLPYTKMSPPTAVSQPATKNDNFEQANVKIVAEKVHTRLQEASNQLRPAIDYMSKADFLRLSSLPDPLPISALPDHLPMTVGDATFDDSQVMSKISCEDTFMSPSGNQETIEEVVEENAEISTSTEDDEEEDCYAWDGHMDDEDFWDMDVRRQSLDHIDELASQVSSQISTLLSKFREDNNSIQTRSVKL